MAEPERDENACQCESDYMCWVHGTGSETSERNRIKQSNDVAAIVQSHAEAFVPLHERYGVADALWDAGYRKKPAQDPLELIRRLQRELEGHASKYTRAFGREDNSARILELTDADVYAISQRLKAVIQTGEDPGDTRFICLTIGCSKGQSHSGDHLIPETKD